MARKFQVSREMVSAGLLVLEMERASSDEESLVRQIYVAMWCARLDSLAKQRSRLPTESNDAVNGAESLRGPQSYHQDGGS